MKPEVNAVLQEVKASIGKPTMPDFKFMSIMQATKWCVENGITSPKVIAETTGKQVNTVHTAMWKLRNPKRVKVLARRAKKAKAIKAGLIPAPKTKPTKVKKPKIINGLYDDGMETPYLDAIHRQGILPKSHQPSSTARQRIVHTTLESSLQADVNELLTENRRLKVLIDHYEALLFKGGR
jgi:hypothetical protein